MELKEYNTEDGESVDLETLKSELMSKEDYIKTHKSKVLLCHDIFIEINEGILVVNRDNFPAKDILWCMGGAVNRGMRIEDSMKKKTIEECGLEIHNLEIIGYAKTAFNTDPFGHGKGTDTFSIVFFARSDGEITLDNLHSDPLIITPKKYTKEFRSTLHPFMKDHMDICMEKLKQ